MSKYLYRLKNPFRNKVIRRLNYLCIFGLYIGFAWLGMYLTSKPPSSLSVIWIPSGIGVLSIIAFGRKGLLLVYLASSIANGGYGFFFAREDKLIPLFTGLLCALVDLLQTWIAWRLLSYSHLFFKLPNDLLKFFLLICLVPPSLTVWILPIIWHVSGGQIITNGFNEYFIRTLQVLFADMLGIFLIAPLYLALRHSRRAEIFRLILVSSILLLIPILLAAFIHLPLISLLGPAVLYLVVKHRLIGSTLSLTLVTGFLLFYISVSQSLSQEIDWFNYFNLSLFILCFGLVPHYIALTLEQLRAAKKTLELRVLERTKELSLANEQLELAANTDILTGLLNRRAFLSRFKYETERAKRSGKTYSLAILDVDNFKKINDNFGHQIGDEVLLAFSQIMISHLRMIDIACRWGGEEFLIFFPDTNQSQASLPLNRIREFVESSEDLSSIVSLKITVSVGISDSNVSALESIVADADKALYAAKTTGRNKICYYNSFPSLIHS